MVQSQTSDGSLVDSYASLPFRDIKALHVPASSPTTTPVILITLNRPYNHNAFTSVMQAELERVYGMIHLDPRVKAVVLTGSGKVFCAGADLQTFPGTRDPNERYSDHRDGGGRVSLAMLHCSKPTIVAIQGAAVGVGITLCLPAAVRIAYTKAKIGFVFSRRGTIMEACSSYFLPRLIGHSRAIHVTTTGSIYPADDPLISTLFSELCSSPELTLTRALALADEIAKNTSTVSTKIMRDMIYRGPDSAEGAHLLDSRLIHSMFSSRDSVEGIRSFLQKRPAEFKDQLPENAPAPYPWWHQVDIGNVAQDSRDSKL